MSKTTTPAPRALRAVPEPATAAEPLSGLTGAPATLFTELTALTAPATTAELALAAGLGRSTVSKALVTLEEHGLATRTPGGYDGARRTPDRWQPAPTPNTTEPLVAETAVPQTAVAETATAPAALPETSSAPDTDENPDAATPAPDTGSNETEAPAPESSTTAPAETPDTAHIASSPGSEAGEAPPAEPSTGPASVQANTSALAPASHSSPAASAPDTATGQPTSPPVTPEPAPPAVLTGGKRLAPGGLRQMVIDHLTAHPDEAFTATKISRVIDRSSGAIANALVTLAKQGLAEQVSDRPRTYRHMGATSA